MIGRGAIAGALLAGLLSAPAAAHDQTISYSTWRLAGRRADVTVRLSRLDVSRFPWAADAADADQRLATYLTEHLVLRAGGDRCAVVVDGPRPAEAAPERIAFTWTVQCPDAGALQINSTVLLEVAPSHLHFARLLAAGAPVRERMLSDAERSWPLGESAPTALSLGAYVGLGVERSLTGYDHLAFLFVLLLVGGALGEMAKVVAGFTVAYSLTLAAGVLGYLHPDPVPIAALIGLSVALIAAENLWLSGGRSAVLRWSLGGALALLAGGAAAGSGRVSALTLGGLALFVVCYFGLLRRGAEPAPQRVAIAFLFGLLHGFGFAGVLTEAAPPAARLAGALFGFHAGVELGQLAVIAVCWLLLRFAARAADERARAALMDYGSAAALTLGVFWFITRTFG